MDTSTILTLESGSELMMDKSVDGSMAVDESNGSILDPLLWENTPAHLIEMIFKRLPFSSLMCFRKLSKGWNSMITSQKFARDCRRHVSPKPVPIVMCTRQDSRDRRKCHEVLYVLNSKTDSWVSLDVPPTKATQGYSFSFVACTWGLMCFSTKDRQQFVVCNPVTGAFKRLEVPYLASSISEDLVGYNLTYIFTGFLVDHDAGAFKLVIVNLTMSLQRRTLLYNSKDGYWRSGEPVPGCDWHRKYPFWMVIDAFTSKESVYCLVSLHILLLQMLRSEFHTPQCAVLKYDIRNNRWLEASLGIDRDVNRHQAFKLVEYQSRVLLVTATMVPLPNTVVFRVEETNDGHKIELKLVEYQSRVLLVTATMVPLPNTVVFRVEETNDGHKIELVEDRLGSSNAEMVNYRVLNDTGAVCWADDVKYSVPRDSESEDNYIRVKRYNCKTQEFSVLPPLCVSHDVEVFSKIKVLEPSITIDM